MWPPALLLALSDLQIVSGPDSIAAFAPINNSLSLQTFSISAKLFDIPTGAEVGVFASVCTFTGKRQLENMAAAVVSTTRISMSLAD